MGCRENAHKLTTIIPFVGIITFKINKSWALHVKIFELFLRVLGT